MVKLMTKSNGVNHESIGSNDEQIKKMNFIACKTVNGDFLKDSINSERLFALRDFLKN